MKHIIFFIGLSVVIFAQDVVIKGHLIWQDTQENSSVKRTWTAAVAYCDTLALDGKSDWRLPSLRELQSLTNIHKYKPAITEGIVHVNTRDFYWSNTPLSGDSTKAWHVYFKYGDSYYSEKLETYYVRCVRNR